MRLSFFLFALGSFGSLLVASGGCGPSGPDSSSSGQGGAPDLHVNGVCKLPGSVQYLGDSVHVVPGGRPTCSGPAPGCQGDLSFLKLPAGFCAHWFGNVGDARQLRFAPGGELFVASPTMETTGGMFTSGLKEIVVLPDDDHDGYADSTIAFLHGLPATQGMMFHGDHFYYQDGTQIRRIPYASGDRSPSGASELVVDVNVYQSSIHWPKTFDVSDDGTIYLGNGGDQNETCESSHPFHGGILKVPASGTTPIEVAKGFRNPIAVRCAPGKNRCFAVELALDFSADDHGREKIVPIHEGDDWGFPCCATKDQAYSSTGSNPNCGGVEADKTSFFIGDTPFGIAFQSPSKPWAAQWADKAIVVLHGAAGTWTGARVVAVGVDPSTGLLEAGTNISGADQGALTSFADGWDDNSFGHGRPAAVEFSSDGRLFIANDNNGDIIWIAPLDF